jgi:hypothetical protein
MMISTDEAGTAPPDRATAGEPMAMGMHPRLRARLTLVKLARRRDVLLARLDRLIGALDHLSQLTGRFAIPLAITQAFREQMTSVSFESTASLLLLDNIKQHMVDVATLLVAEGFCSSFDCAPAP